MGHPLALELEELPQLEDLDVQLIRSQLVRFVVSCFIAPGRSPVAGSHRQSFTNRQRTGILRAMRANAASRDPPEHQRSRTESFQASHVLPSNQHPPYPYPFVSPRASWRWACREDPDDNLAFSTEKVLSGDTTGFDLPGAHPMRLESLETVVAKGNVVTATGAGLHVAAHLLAELNSFGHSGHRSYSNNSR